jgi:hypothetical protein
MPRYASIDEWSVVKISLHSGFKLKLIVFILMKLLLLDR